MRVCIGVRAINFWRVRELLVMCIIQYDNLINFDKTFIYVEQLFNDIYPRRYDQQFVKFRVDWFSITIIETLSIKLSSGRARHGSTVYQTGLASQVSYTSMRFHFNPLYYTNNGAEICGTIVKLFFLFKQFSNVIEDISIYFYITCRECATS